jgi:hypothetical protein
MVFHLFRVFIKARNILRCSINYIRFTDPDVDYFETFLYFSFYNLGLVTDL